MLGTKYMKNNSVIYFTISLTTVSPIYLSFLKMTFLKRHLKTLKKYKKCPEFPFLGFLNCYYSIIHILYIYIPTTISHDNDRHDIPLSLNSLVCFQKQGYPLTESASKVPNQHSTDSMYRSLSNLSASQ